MMNLRLMPATSLLVLAAAAWQVEAFTVAPSKIGSPFVGQQQFTPATQMLASVTDEETTTVKVEVEVKVEPDDMVPDEILDKIEKEAEKAIDALVDETCEVDEEGQPADEMCLDEEGKGGLRNGLKNLARKTFSLVKGSTSFKSKEAEKEAEEEYLSEGELLERGWEKRASSSALVRNAEIWKFALSCVFRVLKPRKMKKKGATEEEIQAAEVEAAEFLRDGLLRLGPSLVKLGQVLSTRTDVLPETYTDVLKTLTDEVPGFSGERAKEIVSKELGKPFDQVFTDFSPEPLKAASLGQVHTAYYNGEKVAIKVQRAGLKELFDVDLKNLRKLAVLLEKLDPKSDGADRDWISIYDESERQLYLEIDYLNEADNTERFANDFTGIDWVRTPRVIRELTTPRVLTMEFVESFKLTDIARVEKEGLDRKLLSNRVADAFLRQIIETGYFHCDPHSGNLCVDTDGNLVYYDYGQMDELKPNVRQGFQTFCTGLFSGGPTISDTELALNAKMLVTGVEQAGVLSKSADRLAVEKLARFFMRTFKNKQLGKTSANIKDVVGNDLQTLTENNSFRFPSTFTFVFRAFVSVEGIGKELDPEFDLGKLAQPFINKFIDAQKGYQSETDKNIAIFKKATGLNKDDINKAVMQPRKVAYVEETLRSMASGDLKIRTRSLENEKALERINLREDVSQNAIFAVLCLNVASLAGRAVLRNAGYVGAGYFALQMLMATTNIKKFDKKQSRFGQSDFEDGADDK